MTKLEGMKPPITPTLGQTRPGRWAGPSSANQTGQASSTTAEAECRCPGPRAAWGGARPQPRRVGDERGGQQRHQADGDHDRADGQQLRGEEELAEEEQREQDAAAEGAVALADQDLVEDGQDQREQHERRPS